MHPTSLLQLQPGLFAKAEYENPTGSIKDRAARSILDHAHRQGLLPPGSTVIEATSGNMGISLAALCRERGLACIIVMPDSMSVERQQRMRALGARVELTPGSLGMAGAEVRAQSLAADIPNSFLPRQFENPANALAHYETTGPEIFAQTQGSVALFVAGIGTGGTITGTGKFLKEQNPKIKIVGVEPLSSPLLTQGTAGSHSIQGIGANFIPGVLDTALPDLVLTVSDRDAFLTARALNKQSIPAGISAGANVYAATVLKAQYPEQCVVTVLPDHADRYASMGL